MVSLPDVKREGVVLKRGPRLMPVLSFFLHIVIMIIVSIWYLYPAV